MPSTATVAHRPRARRAARLPPARSIWASSHPPKMSPFESASAGIAKTRTSGSVRGNSTSDPMPMSWMRRAVTSHNFRTEATSGRMTNGAAYTYKALSLYFRASRVEIIMFMGAQHSWCRRVAVAAAALSMLGLCTGTFAQPATAQVYPGYSSGSQAYPGYTAAAVPQQGSPGYSSPAPYGWGGGGSPGWVWYPGWGWWSPAWGLWNPGWGWSSWG